MAVLVCSFASDRTDSEKLKQYIAYLETMLARNEGNPAQAEAIRILLQRAQRWAGKRDTAKQAS